MCHWPRTLTILLILGLAACRIAPVYNVTNAPFDTELANLDQATVAVKRAGAALGWQMTEEHPGLVKGVLNIRAHQAVVDVTYNTKDFSITYVSSDNLRYDGDTIHSNYNGWIENLERGIRTQSTLVTS